MFSDFVDRYTEERLPSHMVTLFIILGEPPSILLSIETVPVYIPTSSECGFLSLHGLSNTRLLIFYVF